MDKFEQWFKTYRPSLDTSAIEAEFIFEAGLQSRQAEVDELQEEYADTELYLRGQLTDRDSKIANLKYLLEQDKSLIPILNKKLEEKDKRIESALYVLKGLKAENDLWGCDQIEVQIEILEKALRGEHE